MESVVEGLRQAFFLIVTLDREVVGIVCLSLKVSGIALIIATILGVAVGSLTGLVAYPGMGLTVTILNTSMGLPPVLVGLLLYLVLSRRGPLGFLGLLYSPSAMIVAQAILAFPIVAALTQ